MDTVGARRNLALTQSTFEYLPRFTVQFDGTRQCVPIYLIPTSTNATHRHAIQLPSNCANVQTRRVKRIFFFSKGRHCSIRAISSRFICPLVGQRRLRSGWHSGPSVLTALRVVDMVCSLWSSESNVQALQNEVPFY